MMMAGSTASWILVLAAACALSALPAPTDSFVPSMKSTRTTRRTTLKIPSQRPFRDPKLEATPEDSSAVDTGIKNGSTNTNGIKSGKKRRRRKRTCDYPPFAYDIMETNRRAREPLVMKRRDAISGTEEIFRTTTGSTYISVPKENKNGDKTTFLQRLTQSLLGTPLEGGLAIISKSARQTRLRAERSYARKEPFEMENIEVPPSLSDLSPPPVTAFEGFWISTTARLLSYASFYYTFPFITRFVDSFVTMPTNQLDEIASKFGPGISILYGTFISLTLSILYNRQRTIQDNVATECACLVVLTRNLLGLFAEHRERAIEAGQCAADQIRTLVRSSRGAELMLLMYSDPYARMRELVDAHEEELYNNGGGNGKPYNGRMNSLIGNCRDAIKDLYRVRAMRLSDEALALPPTHFLILNILTLLILLGYTVSIIPTLDAQGDPSQESCLLFAVLSTVYVLFYNFASDLNGPFEGVYQIRRSCAASHLLQLKWLIANHPLLRGEIDFEEAEEDATTVQIRCPGLGDLSFDKDDLFVDATEVDELLNEPRPPST